MCADIVVKICGVTNVDDAEFCVREGAHYIGIILASGYTRSVDVVTAKEIAACVKQMDAIPVTVFVDEGVDAIHAIAKDLGVDHLQLHGGGSRSALDALDPKFRVFVAYHLAKGETPRSECRAVPLLEAAGVVPTADVLPGTTPYILAGGLSADNIVKRLKEFSMCPPACVDASSQLCGHDPRRKDPSKVAAFIQAIKVHQEPNEPLSPLHESSSAMECGAPRRLVEARSVFTSFGLSALPMSLKSRIIAKILCHTSTTPRRVFMNFSETYFRHHECVQGGAERRTPWHSRTRAKGIIRMLIETVFQGVET